MSVAEVQPIGVFEDRVAVIADAYDEQAVVVTVILKKLVGIQDQLEILVPYLLSDEEQDLLVLRDLKHLGGFSSQRVGIRRHFIGRAVVHHGDIPAIAVAAQRIRRTLRA